MNFNNLFESILDYASKNPEFSFAIVFGVIFFSIIVPFFVTQERKTRKIEAKKALQNAAKQQSADNRNVKSAEAELTR